jgi:hypothetical protein
MVPRRVVCKGLPALSTGFALRQFFCHFYSGTVCGTAEYWTTVGRTGHAGCCGHAEVRLGAWLVSDPLVRRVASGRLWLSDLVGARLRW